MLKSWILFLVSLLWLAEVADSGYFLIKLSLGWLWCSLKISYCDLLRLVICTACDSFWLISCSRKSRESSRFWSSVSHWFKWIYWPRSSDIFCEIFSSAVATYCSRFMSDCLSLSISFHSQVMSSSFFFTCSYLNEMIVSCSLFLTCYYLNEMIVSCSLSCFSIAVFSSSSWRTIFLKC